MFIIYGNGKKKNKRQPSESDNKLIPENKDLQESIFDDFSSWTNMSQEFSKDAFMGTSFAIGKFLYSVLHFKFLPTTIFSLSAGITAFFATGNIINFISVNKNYIENKFDEKWRDAVSISEPTVWNKFKASNFYDFVTEKISKFQDEYESNSDKYNLIIGCGLSTIISFLLFVMYNVWKWKKLKEKETISESPIMEENKYYENNLFYNVLSEMKNLNEIALNVTGRLKAAKDAHKLIGKLTKSAEKIDLKDLETRLYRLWGHFKVNPLERLWAKKIIKSNKQEAKEVVDLIDEFKLKCTIPHHTKQFFDRMLKKGFMDTTSPSTTHKEIEDLVAKLRHFKNIDPKSKGYSDGLQKAFDTFFNHWKKYSL